MIAGFKPVGLCSMSMWTLLPVMLFASAIHRSVESPHLALAIAVPIVSLLVSPAVAIIIYRVRSVEPHAFHGQLLAKRVDEAWTAATSKPLRFVDGDTNLAYVIATYAHDRPRALDDIPPVKPMKVTRDGKVVVCYATRIAHETLQQMPPMNQQAD
jgi:hypothetical protein